MLRSEGCSLHVVALLDSRWIDKLHRLPLPTGKWAQLPFFGPASHWNPQSGWHYSYWKRETLRATQAPKIVNFPPPPWPLRQQHSIQQHTRMQPHHTLIKNVNTSTAKYQQHHKQTWRIEASSNRTTARHNHHSRNKTEKAQQNTTNSNILSNSHWQSKRQRRRTPHLH